MWIWNWKFPDSENDSGYSAGEKRNLGQYGASRCHQCNSQGVDLLLVSNELYPQVKDKVSCPILIIDNFVDEAEVAGKLLPKLKELEVENK